MRTMRSPSSVVEHALSETDYFQANLDKLLSVLQPSLYCPDLIIKILLNGPDGSGKRILANVAAKKLNLNFCEERAADLFDENIIGTEKKVKSAISKFSTSSPCLIYVSGYELFCQLEDPDLERIESCISETLDGLISSSTSQPTIFLAATNDLDKLLKSPLSSMFQHFLTIHVANPTQVSNFIEVVQKQLELKPTPLEYPDTDSAGQLYLGNLMSIVMKAEIDTSKVSSHGEAMESGAAERLGGIRWADVGGLVEIKREIIDTIQMSLDFPQLKSSGLRRTGILLYGPPGTGKTLLAKAVATECGLHFINVKGPELLNEYVGQSEDNIRRLFQKARESSPSVIFFDELDSLAPNRGQAGDSGGVMDRIVSQILAEMDGVGKCQDVFIIGATNRMDLVDPCLLRPGRFDKVLEVAVPTTREKRIDIIRALTRKMNLAQDVDLEALEATSAPGLSGADFGGICSRALQLTFDRYVQQVEQGLLKEEDANMVTTMEDFKRAIQR